MTRKEKVNVEQRITDSILDALSKGVVPWRKPWKSLGGIAANVISRRVYRGVNVLILALESMSKGYEHSLWLTFKQAREAAVKQARKDGRNIIERTTTNPRTGVTKTNYFEVMPDGTEEYFQGGVRKGETGTCIIFWKPIEVADKDNPGEKKVIRMLRHYFVFNIAQCDGIDHLTPTPEEGIEFSPIEAAEVILNEYHQRESIELIDGGDRAFYRPATDQIGMPKRENFTSIDGYYSTRFHEAAHSTGHKSRLNRAEVQAPAFGTDPYAKEELVAEITAAFLCGHSGIDNTIESSAAYIDHWREQIGKEPKVIIDAAQAAQKATDCILDTKFEDAPEADKTDESGQE